jgi:hypothetical protein
MRRFVLASASLVCLSLPLAACGSTTPAGPPGFGDASTDTGAHDATVDSSLDSTATTPDAGAGDATLPDGAAVPDAAFDASTVCVLSAASTLPHVHVVFTSSTCVFTLAEAAAKVTFTYDLVVDQDVPGFVPASPYPYGSNAANLALTETVAGAGQSYCVCDLGLPVAECPTGDGGFAAPGDGGICAPITIPAGTYHRTFSWDGRNWTGPSDYGNPEGPPFPAGDYTLTVASAAGSLGDAGSLSVVGAFRVRLIP